MKSAREDPEIIWARWRKNKTANLIKSKSKVYELYEAGCFGNKALTWNSYEEILESNWQGLICMRSKKGTERKNVVYNVSFEEITEEIKKWEKLGIPEDKIGFNQSMPDEYLLLQGEVTRIEYKPYDGLTLRYTTIKKPMLLGLKEEDKNAYKLEAYNILKKNLDFRSYENLENLMEIWPENVIEFSTYNLPVGNLKWNTVFWEVRNY